MPNKNRSVAVTIRSDKDGHWVDWSKAGETGSLGPYQEVQMAEDVREAKEHELTENEGHIDEA